MRRSLIYFWRVNTAVIVAAAIATSVLTGALLVGDSVRGSLRNLTLDRLGRIDYALTSDRFFRENLAEDLSNERSFSSRFDDAVPAILLNGSALDVKVGSRASGIQIQGIDERFLAMMSAQPGFDDGFFLKRPDQNFPSIVINASLQKEMGSEIGDPILISFEKQSEVHRESLLGRRNSADVVRSLRLTLTNVIPDRGTGRFGLRPRQGTPLNAFISLPVLAKALGQEGQVNTLLTGHKGSSPPGFSERIETQTLQALLGGVLKLDDLGLILRRDIDRVSLESTRYLLSPHTVNVARSLSVEFRTPHLPLFTYLANSIRGNKRTTPYSTITAIDFDWIGRLEEQEDFGRIRWASGIPKGQLADDEILLNEWAAQDLGVKVNDPVTVGYYVVGPGEELHTRETKFRLKGVLELSGFTADPGLTPKFPGILDAKDISAWEAPFPMNMKQIRPKDEAYWDEFGAAPKAFISGRTGQRLWGNRFGSLTGIWIGSPPGGDLEGTLVDFRKGLLDRIRPEEVGLAFIPVKAEGLEAATGATDFSGLFVGFSLFLIVSAALLVGLLFRLGVEERVKEVGTLLSLGYPIPAVRRRFMGEGIILAGIGGMLGVGGAVVYAWLLTLGLRTWWLAAVGIPFIFLHIDPVSLVGGYLISLLVVLISIRFSFRLLGRMPVRALLSGVVDMIRVGSARISRRLGYFGLSLGVFLIVAALVRGTGSSVELFFGSGAAFLTGGLAFFSVWIQSWRHRGKHGLGFGTILRMGAGNCARRPGRSLLCTGLVGCACFIIVSVGSSRREEMPSGKATGTGGFDLVAESDIPLHHDLNTEAGRFEMGFPMEGEWLKESVVFPFRTLPGEDVSCLNLYRPERPRILGVSRDLISRGGFQFQEVLSRAPEEAENPWLILEKEIEPGVIPAIGDYNSVRWILHLGLGQDLNIRDESGRETRLRLVGLLHNSLFQGELLISEASFTRLFPNRSGYGYFLIETPPAKDREVASELEQNLGTYGFDVSRTGEKLARYQSVENTYLSTFQTLGGLGLILGTFGLGIVLIRNAIERRGELATLRAFGFRRSTLMTMLLAENGFTLVLGLLIGSVSALIAVAPHLISQGGYIPWVSLFITLILVGLFGLAASAVAALYAVKAPLMPSLKSERG